MTAEIAGVSPEMWGWKLHKKVKCVVPNVTDAPDSLFDT